ncbi:hypothetical protein CKM354_000037700 [Cercospora kikuchii]|uniref:Uncharacterized protein n=1 Tax=Cercospora kikuchii TaxID=84275 RepID=A0A9P3C654_9PEZI|nr:uncharacterized protein CKM354_000037700 [Cercospora kikuchii]GIZ36911.1 hypothetical protein CKM354_000037700 [Cercospora kikuchii]
MSILWDQLYTSHTQVPSNPASKAFQQTTMYQAANGASTSTSHSTTSASSTKSSKAGYDKMSSDSASMMSYSSTASTIALIKDKFRTSSSSKKTPAQKQAEKRATRMDNVTLGTVFALK